jgi:hypothetical protein
VVNGPLTPLIAAEIPVVEHLAGLDRLADERFRFSAVPDVDRVRADECGAPGHERGRRVGGEVGVLAGAVAVRAPVAVPAG